MNSPPLTLRVGEGYRLERRYVYQVTAYAAVFVIVDHAGDLYAFLDQMAAECQWRDMGIRALAKQEAA